MRIEKIRLKNLASLEGEWEIDFTCPEYIRDGIFAITGATGAGKTTIFDAIRLALFRRTNRLDGFALENEIMTRGTGECFAKLQFLLENRRYVATWSQSRSRGKTDGKLQNDRHSLELMGEDGTLELLSEQRKQTEKAIRDLLKMDFDHFSRAMLLPQGEFAIFLKTPAAERSEILEQITGSAIYKQISACAYAKYHAIKAELDLEKAKLESIELIPTEELANLKIKKQQSGEESIRRSTLANALLRVNELSNQIESTQKEIELLETENLASAPALVDAKNASILAVTQAKTAQHKREKMLPLIAEARKIDEKIRIAVSELQGTKKMLGNEERSLLCEQQELAKLKISIAEAEKIKQLALNFIAEHPQDALLIENIAIWNAKLDDLASLQAQFKVTEQNCVQQKIALDQLQSKHLDPQKTLLRLALERDKCLKQKNELDAKYNALGKSSPIERDDFQMNTALQCQKLQELIESADRLIADRRRLNNIATEKQRIAQNNDQAQLELKQLDRKYRELEARFKNPNFTAERTELHDGVPCPLCGAKHHPYAAQVTSGVEDELHGQYRLFTNKISELQSQISSNSGEMRRLDAQHIDFAEKLKQETQTLTDKSAPWIPELAIDDPELIRTLKQKLSLAQELHSRAEKLHKKNRQINDSLGTIEADLQKSRQEEEKIAKQLVLAKQKLEDSVRRKTEVCENLQKLELELTKILASFNCDFSNAKTCLATRLKRFRLATCEMEKATTSLAGFIGEQNRLCPAIKQHRKHLDELGQIRDSQQKSVEELQKSRSQLLEGVAVTVVEDALEHACKTALTAERAATTRLHQLEERRIARHATQENCKKRIAELLLQLGDGDKDGKNRSERAAEAEKLTVESRLLNEEAGAIAQKLQADKSRREQRKTMEKQLTHLEDETDRWRRLNDLIGKQDGGKFQQFAQSLIFEQLIILANQSLQRFTDRYLLVSIDDSPLDFNVIDHYQCDEIRSIKNLSGGESFLVSMSLALALSRMSGEHFQIDTLFLDEGFGTLDEETLAHVLAQIQTLRSEDKLVGIITHVPGIENFIPLQIRLIPAEKSGRSLIAGVGVTQL